MSGERKRTEDADAAMGRLREVFIGQIRAHGRIHHRALLGAMRRHLDTPATETAQDLAMLLRGKLGLLPQKVRDIEGVRRALKAVPDSPEGPR